MLQVILVLCVVDGVCIMHCLLHCHQNAGGYVEVCQECEGFGQQEEILTCCQCAASYHTYCMDPPWEGVPNPQWRCPVCIAEEYNKPPEVFGFEQASKEYTLREYLEMANKFKEEYFLEPIIVSEVASAVANFTKFCLRELLQVALHN